MKGETNMKKYTDKEFKRLKRKYLTAEELEFSNSFPTLFLLFNPGWEIVVYNFALLIRAAEGEL